MHRSKERLVLLGAGFTAPLGMPVTAELLHEVHAIARRHRWTGTDGQPAAEGMADWLLQTLDWYFPLAGITHETFRLRRMPGQVSLEALLSFVSVRATLGYRQPQDVDASGVPFIDCMRSWLGEAVALQQAHALGSLQSHYLAFAHQVRNDRVVSFNWNTVLEQLWREQRTGTGEQAACRLVKVHGSIDWFPMRPGLQAVHGLDGVGRAAHPIGEYRRGQVPLMVIPTFDKAAQLPPFEQLWHQPWSALEDVSEVLVVGYSIRPDDYHSRAVLYPQLVRRAAEGGLRVRVVDHAHTAQEREAVRGRYEGVRNCEFHFDGFTPAALEFLFD